MHPDLIRALARERQAENLRARQFRDTNSTSATPGAGVASGPVRRVRRSMGSALVHAGMRLIPETVTVDLSPTDR
jgi:hypothetical protein